VPTPGIITTYAGSVGSGPGTSVAQGPWGLALSGTTLYIADFDHAVVRSFNTGTGAENVVAGTGVSADTGDGGQATLAGIESPTGIRLLDEAGRCVPEALEVLALAAEHDVLVATGHLSAGEVGELVRSASAAGVRRLLVQHPCFPVPALAADGLEPLVRAGAAVELTYLTVSPRWQTATASCTCRRIS